MLSPGRADRVSADWAAASARERSRSFARTGVRWVTTYRAAANPAAMSPTITGPALPWPKRSAPSKAAAAMMAAPGMVSSQAPAI